MLRGNGPCSGPVRGLVAEDGRLLQVACFTSAREVGPSDAWWLQGCCVVLNHGSLICGIVTHPSFAESVTPENN